MGCDGGTIPRRDELVKVKKKPEAKDKQAELSFQWRCCAITQEVLEEPIVTCGLGRLYNKSALIEGLLNRALLPSYAKHVRSLKDIKDLNLTPNPEFDPNADKREGMIDSRAAPYICPVIGLEMSGKFRFVCLWSCGCVMSERALKEIKTNVCHKCQTPFQSNDVIVLNGTESDLEVMKQNMEERQALQKSKKKSKKTSTVTVKEEPIEETTSCPTSSVANDTSSILKPSTSGVAKSTTIKRSVATASASLEDPDIKKIKTENSVAKSTTIKRSVATASTSLEDPDIKKIKTDYSVAKDPKVTDVYKSLFTTHQSEKDQTRAHWITYNPFYN